MSDIKIETIDENLVITYRKDIQSYLKEVLVQNSIKCGNEEIENIYKDMNKYIQDKSAIIIGAFEKEKLLGFLWGYERNIGEEKRIHINYFIVNSEYRKLGIGRRLINTLYKIAETKKVKKVELIVTANNEEAVKFYKKQEFKVERITLCKQI